MPQSKIPNPQSKIKNYPCRLLGLQADHQTSFNFPHPGNACYAVDPALPVRPEHQVTHCLSPQHGNCSLYRSFNNGVAGPDVALDRAEVGQILDLGARRSLPLGPLMGAVGLVVVLGLAFLFFTNAPAFPAFGNGGGVFTPTPTSPGSSMAVFSIGTAEATPEPFLPLAETPAGERPTPTSAPPTETPQPEVAATEPVEAVMEAASPTPEVITEEALPTAETCGRPPGWVLYVVQPGDSLSKLSRATGASVDAIRQGNCLVVGGLIYVGQRLYLPSLPAPTSTATHEPTHEPEPTATATPTEEVPTIEPTRQVPTLTATPPPATSTPEPTLEPTEPPTEPPAEPMPTPTMAPTSGPPTASPSETPDPNPDPTATP